MIVLITGGSGFIGKNLAESMASRYEVLAPPRHQMDLLDEDSVRRFLVEHRIDVVVHSATTPGHRNAIKVSDLASRNLRMFFNLARNADRFKRMIFLGSGAIYDLRHYRPKMKEEYFDSSVPADEHGFSKYVCSKYIEQGQTNRIVDLRLFGVFGKYEDYEIRFISNAICKTLFELPITIKQNRFFDYFFIDDLEQVIDFFIANEPEHKCYNVTPDQAVDLRTLAEIILKVSGKHLEIITKSKEPGPEYSGDNTRLRKEFQALKLTKIEAAISKLYFWYLENKHLIKKELLMADK